MCVRHGIGLVGSVMVAAILLFQDVSAQNCLDVAHTTVTNNPPTTIWPVTWVPECTPELKFSVKMNGADGVAKILLASDTTPSKPYFIIQLGWNGAKNAVGTTSYLGVCTADESDSNCDNGIDAARESTSSNNGDVNENGLTTFVLTTSTDGIHLSYENQEAFLSLNNLDSTSFDPKNTRFVGLQAHTGDGTSGLSSNWKFCTDDWTDITGTVTTSDCKFSDNSACDGGQVLDGNIDTSTFTGSTTCFAIDQSGNAAFWRIDMGEEKHIVGVTIYNGGGTGGDSTKLDGVEVYVGSCLAVTGATLTYANIQDNIMCSGTFDSITTTGPFYRACPTNTYGQHVFVTHNANDDFQLCEVVIHGKDISDGDKTTIEFSSEAYSVMESPVPAPSPVLCATTGTPTDTVTVSVKRTSSVSPATFTCSSVEYSVSGGSAGTDDYGTISQGNTYMIDFTPADTTKDIDINVKGDCSAEGDETITLKLANPNDGQLIGSQSSTIVTFLDDDPTYKFSVSSDSVWENEPSGKITLTVERSDYTDVQTTIHVNVVQCAPDAPIGDDFIGETAKPVTFDATILSQTVDIYIINDDGNVDDEDEKFCVELDEDESRRGELGSPNMVEVTILNDDTVYQFSSSTYAGGENDDEITVVILREGKTDTTGCIDVFSEPTSGALAATVGNNNDYPAYSRSTISFIANEESKTINIPINNDELVEGDETFKLRLALPTSACGADLSAVVGTTTPDATLTIEDDDTTYSAVSLINSIPESAKTVTVSFERVSTIRPGTIMVEVSGGTNADTNIGTSIATEEVDFMNAGIHPVTFETGEATATLTIPIVDDPYIELNEAFSVEIVEADSEINEGRKRTDVYITNNDAYFSIQKAERTVLESVEEFHVVVQRGSLEVGGVTLSPYLDNDVTIVVNTNSEQSSSGATAGSDFVTESKSLTFSGATQEAVKTCAIKVINDEVVEGPEIFFVTISNDNVQIDPERSQTTITIEDDDGRITCSVDGETSVSIDEDEDAVTVTCTRNGINNDDGDDQSLNRAATLVLTAVSASARQGQDFNAYSATLQFPPNVATIMETINDLIIDDTEPENEETFRLEITDADSEIDTSSSFITVTILDNDVEEFGFEEMEYTVGESCDSLQVVITKTSGNSGLGTTLRIAASDGAGNTGATYPDDYATREVTVQFLGNQQQQIVTIDINKDNVNEGSESFSLTLSKVSGSGEVDPAARTATVTIEDQIVTYSVQDARITRDESSGTMPVTFVRTGDFCQSDSIYVSTVDGTARSREDYISFNNRLVTFDRASTTASVDLTILDDDNEESSETFNVQIESTNIQIGTGTTTVTIQDDDGRVSFRESEYNVVEGSGTVTLTIDRVGNAVTRSQVRVQTVSGRGTASPGSDYTAVSNMFVEFEASQTSKTFTVSIIDDNEVEDEETFTVAIISTTDGTVFDPSEAVVTIEDDDEPPAELSTATIIAITAGVGGGVLVLMVIVGILIVAAVKSGPGAGAAAAPPIGYNGPAVYPPSYQYGPDYGRPQRIGYYR